MSKYYVVVELRDYSDRIVGYSSCSLGEDISNQSIADGVRVAGRLMVNHHTGIREEQILALGRINRQLAETPNAEN